jgi:drug/metabolite transporter (DMT)-like permease
MQSRAHFWGWVLLFVSLVWGIEFALVHEALDSIGPNSFNSLRFIVAALTLWVYFSSAGIAVSRTMNRACLHHGIVLGFLLFAGFSTQSVGLQYTSASNAGFITGLNVVLVPLIAWIWLKEHLRWYVWTGVALATVGTLLLTGGPQGFGEGERWVLACAFAFAMHIVYTGVYVRQVEPLALTFVQLVVVAILSVLTSLLYEFDSLQAIPGLLFSYNHDAATFTVWLAILVGGVLGTGLAYVAQTVGQQSLASWRVALIFATEPLFAALGGFYLLDETLTLYAWLGAVCIIAGMLVAELVGEDFKPQKTGV